MALEDYPFRVEEMSARGELGRVVGSLVGRAAADITGPNTIPAFIA
jgi:hypothetical protein